jgi:pimeloyl-ACP methyl ester carboxylesterase
MARFEPASGQYVHIEVQGVDYRVYYEASGQGIPVFCQHTAGADGLQWRHLMNDADITSRVQVVAADLPYHGKSLPPESEAWWSREYQLTRSFFIDFLVEFSHALGLDRPIFIGAAFGGFIGLDLALDRPDEFRAVVALEAALYGRGGPLPWWDHPRVDNNSKTASMWSMMSPVSPEKYRRETIWGFGQSGPSVLVGDFNYYFFDHDLRETAGRIDTGRIPVYLLTGEYDPACSAEESRISAQQIKGARFIEMKGLGHLSLCENPELLKSYLMPVFEEIAGR